MYVCSFCIQTPCVFVCLHQSPNFSFVSGLGSQIGPETQLKGLRLPFGAFHNQTKNVFSNVNLLLPRFWQIRWTSADLQLRRCKLGSGRCLQSRFIFFSSFIKLTKFSFSSDPRMTRRVTTTWPRYSSGRAGGSRSPRRTPCSSSSSSLRTRCGSRITIELLCNTAAKQRLVKKCELAL